MPIEKTYPKTIFTLLSLLNLRPMSGYDIKIHLKNMVNHFWSESDGQIYPGLQQCVDDGLAIVQAHAQDTKPVQKKIYQITPEGRTLLLSWFINSESKMTHRDESLLKLTFLQHEPQARQLLLARLMDTEKNIEAIQSLSAKPLEMAASLPYLPLVQERVRLMLEAEIQWIKLSLNQLSKNTPSKINIPISF